MNVTIRDANDAKVVDFEGSLDTSTSPDAEGRLSSLMEGEGVKILINFEKLDYISSAGLRVLLVSAKRLKSLWRRATTLPSERDRAGGIRDLWVQLDPQGVQYGI